MAAITNYPKVLSLASTDIVTIHDASSGRTKRTDIVQICKYARDYIQLGEDLQKVDYLQELMTMLTIVDGDLVITSSDGAESEDGLATTSAVRSLITEATDTLASAEDLVNLNSSLTAYINGSIVSFTTADAVHQLITNAGVNYATAQALTTLRTAMEGYTNGQLTSYSTSTAIQELVTTSTDAVASAQWVTDLEVEMKNYTDGQLSSYSTSTAIQELVTSSTSDLASAESVTTLETEMQQYVDGQLTSYSTSTAIQQLVSTSTAEVANAQWVTDLNTDLRTYADGVVTGYATTEAVQGLIADSTTDQASAEAFTKLQSELGTFDEEGNLQTLSSSIAEQVLSTENTAQFAQADYVETLEAQFTDEDGNTLISRIDENKQVIAGVDGKTEAIYTLEVDSGDNIAGMRFGSSAEGSEIRFTADSFKISNGTVGETPFEVVDGNVKIKSASIGSITFGDITDVPDTFTTTIIYADDESGTNASTTKGTKNYIAFYNTLWVDGDDVSNITFDKISGNDGTSVNILGSVDSESELPATGNSSGDGYLINGVLWVWNGTSWENAGNIQGPAGPAGASKYTWVKYADNIGGELPWGFSDHYLDKKYIGMAFNKDTATESASPNDYTWNLIKGEDGLPGTNAGPGENGKKTASGTLFFQQGTQSAPTAPSNSSAVFLFVNGLFTGLPSGWGLSTPEMGAGTASNNYWTVSWSAIEQVADSNEGTVTFGEVTRSFAFNQVVSFDSLETSGSTIINGDNITTGIIKSASYLNTSGDEFSEVGMAVDLDNGSIHAEKFYINPDGNANFAGNHGSGTLGGWEINESRIFKDSDTGGISLSSERNALEIYDEDNNLAVDINNKNTLSSVQGATTYPTGTVTSAGNHNFEVEEPINYPGYDIYYKHNDLNVKTYSNGQFNFATQADSGESMRLTADLGNKLLISVLVDYPSQWDVRLKATVGMEVYTSTGSLVTTVYKDFDENITYQVNGDSATLRTGTTNLEAVFNSSGTGNYYCKFFTKDYSMLFNGDPAQSTATIEGFMAESLVISGQGVLLVQDANKTEMVAGGFQVVKSSSQYFRADREGQSWLSSSGQWLHNGGLLQTSDKNQKYNIKPIDFDLALLSNINGYNYSQIVNPIHELPKANAEDIHTIESAGLIAQEIEAVLPNAVSTNENGIKALDYSATTGLLMNIVKQLNDKITALELEINNLKN
tara:strand:+ start:1652 stop:5248 length:3597 start_codon:yes stop_codon:yes gene_type:complete